MIPFLENIFKLYGAAPFFSLNNFEKSLGGFIVSMIPNFSENLVELITGKTHIDKVNASKMENLVMTLGTTST